METGKNPSAWRIESREPVADCRVFQVERRRSRRVADGRTSDWFVIQTNDFVNVVAVTAEEELVLVRQFRHGSDEFSWEIPGGMVDEGEEPLAAGVRELAEETGYAGESARIFARCHPNPAIMDNWCHFVLATDVRRVSEPDWDENEQMEIRTVPMAEVREMLAQGRLTHSLTLAALLHYFLP